MRKSALVARVQHYLPGVAGMLLIALFARLGIWQLDRAAEKNALAEAFASPASVTEVSPGLEPEPYQPIAASGHYLADRQVLIENIVNNGRIGYYAITPLEISADQPLLLVNRGWIPKSPEQTALPDLSLADGRRRISGRAGRLPRVGIRPGEAFADRLSWPRVGVWPTYQEMAAEIGRDVLPFVLLLDPDQESGFARQWQPRESGSSTHYGYAFQWFAMAIAVAALLGWQLSRGRKPDAD